MSEPIQPTVKLKQVLHFESTNNEFDDANDKLKEGWLYLGMTKNESGEVYLILGQSEESGPVE